MNLVTMTARAHIAEAKAEVLAAALRVTHYPHNDYITESALNTFIDYVRMMQAAVKRLEEAQQVEDAE